METSKYKIYRSQKNLLEFFPQLSAFEHIQKCVTSPSVAVNELCLPWKLIDLWEILMINKPMAIMELGPGWTTFVFEAYKQYMLDTYNAHVKLMSIEESEKYATIVRINGEKIGIDPEIFIYEKNVDSDNKCVNYRMLTELATKFFQRKRSMLYVDGPSNTIDGADHACTDAKNIIDYCRVDNIVFDLRNSSFWHTDSDPSYFSEPGYGIDPENAKRYHSVIRRLR